MSKLEFEPEALNQIPTSNQCDKLPEKSKYSLERLRASAYTKFLSLKAVMPQDSSAKFLFSYLPVFWPHIHSPLSPLKPLSLFFMASIWVCSSKVGCLSPHWSISWFLGTVQALKRFVLQRFRNFLRDDPIVTGFRALNIYSTHVREILAAC